MRSPEAGVIAVSNTKDVLQYLTEHDHDSIRDIVRAFPLSQSKDLVFANLTDEKKYKTILHDASVALITQKARLPRTLKTQSEYWTAKTLIQLRATRAQGPQRDRVLASTQRTETTNVSEVPARPRTGVRRWVHL